jgi:hypothetical protein
VTPTYPTGSGRLGRTADLLWVSTFD